MLISLVLSCLLSISSAHAEEPSGLTPPAVAATPSNVLGLVKPAVVVTHDVSGCPLGYTPAPQFMSPRAYDRVIGATAEARATCVIATAKAAAIEDRGEAYLLEAKGDYNSETLLAWAGAYAVRTAANAGVPVYLNARTGVVATREAAPLAAIDGNLGADLSPWVLEGAMDVAALRAVNGNLFVSPETAPVTSSAPPPQAAPTSDPVEPTVNEIEDRLRKIVGEKE